MNLGTHEERRVPDSRLAVLRSWAAECASFGEQRGPELLSLCGDEEFLIGQVEAAEQDLI